MTCPLLTTTNARGRTVPLDAREECTAYSAKREARGEPPCFVLLFGRGCLLDAAQVAEKIKRAKSPKEA